MVREYILFFLIFAILSSCGSKGSSTSSTPATSVTYANPGPSACVVNGSSGLIPSPPTESYYANFREALAFPLKNNLNRNNNNSDDSKKNLLIIGGNTVASQALANCGASNDDTTKQAYNVSNTNTVAIFIPSSGLTGVTGAGEICTGTIVGDGSGNYLVLTAAHCFDHMANYSDTTAGGAKVFLTNSANFFTPVTASTTTVSCWQRSPSYHNQQVNSSDFSTNLFDIAWIKLAEPAKVAANGYSNVRVLTNPSSIASTDEKLMVGFGSTSTSGSSDGNKRCVSTHADTNYSGRGDIVPSGSSTLFNSNALSVIGVANAYENYLTVIGPINSSAKGTCFGDSGGPVYIYKSNNWVLGALTQGSDNLLTPRPTVNFSAYNSPLGLSSLTNFDTSSASNCEAGYGTYTTLGNHINWIQRTSGVSLQTQ